MLPRPCFVHKAPGGSERHVARSCNSIFVTNTAFSRGGGDLSDITSSNLHKPSQIFTSLEKGMRRFIHNTSTKWMHPIQNRIAYTSIKPFLSKLCVCSFDFFLHSILFSSCKIPPLQVLYERSRLLPLLFIGLTWQTHSPKKIQKVTNQVHRPAGQFLV